MRRPRSLMTAREPWEFAISPAICKLWKRHVVAVAVAVAAMYSPGCGRSNYSNASTSPQVECLLATVDLGSLDVKKPLTKNTSFEIRNTTQRPVAIRKITTSCGCLAAEDYESEIPALGSVEINLNLVVAPVPGAFSRKAIVQFASEEIAPVQLSVTGSVDAGNHMRAYPEVVQLGEMVLANGYCSSPSSHTTKEIVVSRYDGLPFALRTIRSKVPWLVANCEKTGEQAVRHTIYLKVTPSMASAGDIDTIIDVEQEDGETPVSVRVRGSFLKASDLFSGAVVVNELRLTSPKEIEILSQRGAALAGQFADIQVAVDGIPGVAVSLQPGRRGEPKARIQASAECKGPPLIGRLVLSSREGNEQVVIPLTILSIVP